MTLLPALIGAALALEPQQLVGSWTLDVAASEPVLDLLEASGVGWVERQALARLPIEQVFTIEGTDLVVRIDTPLGARTERLPLRGETKRGVDAKGLAFELRTHFEAEALVTTMRHALPEGTRTFVIRRSLTEEGRVLRQNLALTLPDGRALSARRTFRRSP